MPILLVNVKIESSLHHHAADDHVHEEIKLRIDLSTKVLEVLGDMVQLGAQDSNILRTS